MSTSTIRCSSVCVLLVLAFVAAGFSQNAAGYGDHSPVDLTKVSGQLTVDSSVVFDATTGRWSAAMLAAPAAPPPTRLHRDW